MKILITGAGGYIGSTLVETFLENGHSVVGLDRYFFGKDLLDDLLENDRFTLVQKDIRDCDESDFIGIDAVCDLAALSNDTSGDLDPKLTESINALGRIRVATMAKKAGVKRYVLASSCSVYGDGQGEKLTEESSANPLTVYASANYNAEQGVLPLADSNFSVTVLRQATVYGLSRRMRFDLVINIMTLNAVKNGTIHVLGGGVQWRPLVHVRDTSRAFMAAIDADIEKVNGEVFNVGSSDQNYQILSLAYIVRENLPFPVNIDMTPSDADKRNYNIAFDKIKNILGYEVKYTPEFAVDEIYNALKYGKVDTGIKTSTVKWYKYLLDSEKIIEDIKIDGKLL